MRLWAGPLAVFGLAAVLQPVPAGSQEGPPARVAPADLKAIPVSYGRIDLSWTDTAAKRWGYRIERRSEKARPWTMIDILGPDTTDFIDDTPTLRPESEYCYRLVAFDGTARLGYSNESCATTLAVPPISCTPDTVDARVDLTEILTEPEFADWREEAGLSNADPSILVLVTDDSICQKIWAGARPAPPDNENPQYYHTFWQIGDLYILRSSLVAEHTWGYSFTSVLTSQFESLDVTLAF